MDTRITAIKCAPAGAIFGPALPAALMLSLLSACGGGGSDGPPPPEPPPPNSAPTITVSSTASVDENQAGAEIASVETSDPDGDTVTVSVSDDRFEVSEGNLKLKNDQSLDFESETSVQVTLTASDGSASTTADVTITVNDVMLSVAFVDATAGSGLQFQRGYLDNGNGEGLAQDADVREFGGGVAAGDYDNDGWVDLFVVRGDIGPNLLYRNLGNNTFEDRAAEAGVAFTRSASESYKHSGPGFADLDGDGHLDLFIGGTEGDPAKLYRNNGDGTFTDVTAGSGLEQMNARYTLSSAFGDYDLDGDLDLFLSHWGTPRPKDDTWPYSTENLWRNDTENGVIRFTDVSLASGIAETIIDDDPQGSFGGDGHDYTFSPIFARITEDRYPDLVIASDFRTSRYYINEGDGSFRDATDREVIIDGNGMGAAVGDYDGDGDLDWFVSSIWTDPDENGEQLFEHGNRLYRNDGGTLSDATEEAGVRDGSWGWGSCFADFDNDGDLDLYHTNGWVPVARFADYNFDTDPSRLFISDGAGVFTEQSVEAGIVDNERGHGVVCGDLDNDGDTDVFLMHRNENNAGTLWRNDTSANNFLRVKLEGRSPNTAAAGARIRLTASGGEQLREITVGSNFTSQNPLVQVFGLGSDTQADIVVEWPDGSTTMRENVAANQLLNIQQPGD
ncbi:FG-GAP-like repeat-containing protein [Candidatus Foliamicus sp.]